MNGGSARRLVPLALALAVTAISFAAIFFRLAAPTHPLVMAGLRLVLAALVLAPMVLRAWRAGRVSRRLLASACWGGLLYGLHFGTWVSSLTLTTVASSVTLVTATPILLGLWAAWAGRDRPGPTLWAAIALGLVGVSILGGGDAGLGEDALVGDGLALGGAVAMAGYMLTSRALGEALDVGAFLGIATAVGGALLLGCAWLLDLPLAPASAASFGWILLAALVPQLIGHSLLTWSLRWTAPTVVGMATVGEPVGSAALAWLWLGESLEPVAIVGCTITIGAVFLALACEGLAQGSEEQAS